MIELTVNDIKQYCYCQRIVFFNHIMPVDRKPTYKMIHGQSVEEKIIGLENKRKLKKYNLDKGERIFHLRLTSEKIGLSGKIDMLIKSPEGYFPVDFKYTTEPAQRNHFFQLAGYALLIEDRFRVTVDFGFIYLIPRDDLTVVNLTEKIKNETLDILEEIREMIKKEKMPEATPFRTRCLDCEFKNFCGDVF